MFTAFDASAPLADVTGQLGASFRGDTVQQIHKELRVGVTDWPHKGVLAALQLSWSLFLQWHATQDGAGVGEASADRAVPSAVVPHTAEALQVAEAGARGGSFAFLASVLASDIFDNDLDNTEVYCELLDNLVSRFIANMSPVVRELKLDETAAQTPVSESNFVPLLRAVAALYRRQPHLGVKYWGAGSAPAIGATAPFDANTSVAFMEDTDMWTGARDDESQQLAHFVQFAGDEISAHVFAPYMDMLAALSSHPLGAHSAYHWLRSSTNKQVSWDTWFSVLERTLLDFQEPQREPSRFGGQYGGVVVSPLDVINLEAFLRVITAVALHAPAARSLMAASREWHPLESLLGLLGCPIPPSLKAHLLAALAAFARSPDLLRQLWTLLEVSQVLQTVPGTSTSSSTAIAAARGRPAASAPMIQSGVRYELEEVESRSETYPETLAFIRLLHTLLAHYTPAIWAQLGAPHRTPGLLPYVAFVRDAVFCRFDSRAYANPAEMWQVAAASLALLRRVLLLSDLSSDSSSTTASGESAAGATATASDDAVRSAARDIFAHLVGGPSAPLLRKLLWILRQGAAAKTAPSAVAGASCASFTRTVLLALQFCEDALDRQDALASNLRGVVVSPLQELLADDTNDVVRIAELAGHTNSAISLHGFRLLQALTERGIRLLPMFADVRAAATLTAACVQAIEADEQRDLARELAPEDDPRPLAMQPSYQRQVVLQRAAAAATANTSVVSMSGVPDASLITSLAAERATAGDRSDTQSVRVAVMELLLASLQQPPPTLAHVLLGFKTAGLRSSDLLNATHSCLHAIIRVFERSPHFSQTHAKFADLSWQLLYALVAAPLTSLAALEFLRLHPSRFLTARMAELAVPLPPIDDSADSTALLHALNQRTWMLKTIALRLHTSYRKTGDGGGEHLRDNQIILDRLFGRPAEVAADEFTGALDAHPLSQRDSTHQQRRRGVVDVLDAVGFELAEPQPPRCHFFTALDLRLFARPSPRGAVPLLDIPALHAHLRAEQTRLRDFSYGSGQQGAIGAEAQAVLRYAVQRNRQLRLLEAKLMLFDGWKQVVAALLSTSFSLVARETREAVLYELLDMLLARIASERTEEPLAQAMADAVLLLMASLRQHRVEARLEGSALQPHYLPVPLLLQLLSSLVRGIGRAGAPLDMRGTLYASLLNYLQYTERDSSTRIAAAAVMSKLLPGRSGAPAEDPESQSHVDELTGAATSSEAEAHRRQLDQGRVAILQNTSASLVRLLCTDAAEAPDVWRAVGFSALDALVRQDDALASTLNALRPSLAHFVALLRQQDDALNALFSPAPDTMGLLYVYESEMSLLLSIAQTAQGALLLVELGVVARLSSCRFLDNRPEDSNVDSTDWLPSVMERFSQLLLPVLRLFAALVAALPKHAALATQVCDFLAAHVDLVSTVLRDRAPVITLTSLRELEALTAVFVLLAPHADIVQDRLALQAPRVQQMLLALLQKYASPERWRSRARPLLAHEQQLHAALLPFLGSGRGEPHVTEFMQAAECLARDICRNVVSYARVLLHRFSRTTFAPSMTAAATADVANVSEYDVPMALGVQMHAPPLSTLVFYIRSCHAQLLEAQQVQDTLKFRLVHAHEMAPLQLAQVGASAHAPLVHQESISPQQRLARAHVRLSELLAERAAHARALLAAMENALYVLHKHLDVFLKSDAVAPSRTSALLVVGPSSTGAASTSMGRLVGAPALLTRNEQDDLRRDSASALGALLRKLTDTDVSAAGLDFTFVQTFARALRSLVVLSNGV